jgi:uncharacterized membrane protein YidH (DUF202 family)
VFDSGLQAERTLLAWQCTLLEVAIACGVAVRFSAPYFGASVVILGFLWMSVTTAAYFGVRLRYRKMHSTLLYAGTLVTVSVWPIPMLAISTLGLGGLALAFLLIH